MRHAFSVAALFAAVSATEFLNEPQMYAAEPIVTKDDPDVPDEPVVPEVPEKRLVIANINYDVYQSKATFYLGKTTHTPIVNTPISFTSQYTTLRDNEVSLAPTDELKDWQLADPVENTVFPSGGQNYFGEQPGSWKVGTLSSRNTADAGSSTGDDFSIFVSEVAVGQGEDLRSPWVGLGPRIVKEVSDIKVQERSSYLWQQKSQGNINRETISFNFPQNQQHYELILGATTLSTTNDSKIPVFDVEDGAHSHWGLSVKDVKFFIGDEEVLIPEEEVDPEAQSAYEVMIGNSLFMSLPTIFFNAASSQFGDAGFDYAQGVYYSKNTCEYFDKLEDITLSLNGWKFTLPSGAYLSNTTGVLGPQRLLYRCVVALQETIKDEIILGLSFYKNYAVLLDNEALTVSLGVSPNAINGVNITGNALAGLAASVFGVFGIAALAL